MKEGFSFSVANMEILVKVPLVRNKDTVMCEQ